MTLALQRRVAGGMDYEERAQFAIWVERQGGRVHRWLPLIGGVAYSLPRDKSPVGVLRAGTWDEPDVIVRALDLQSTTQPRRATWNVVAVQAPSLWDQTEGEDVAIAIVDTGVDLDNPGLRVRGGYNAIEPGEPPEDDNGHGTHVAGIAAGKWDTGTGVAPQAAVLPVKVLDSQGVGSLSDVVDGLHWCLQRQAPIINLSLGASQATQSMKAAVEALWKAGLLVLAAAGNAGPRCNTVAYPAKWPETVAVAASTQASSIATFSSRGSQVDIAAPGQSILSLWLDGTTRYLSGTSMATPHVSGVAALLWSVVSRTSGSRRQPRDLIQPLLEGSNRLPDFPSVAQGHGLVQALNSFNILKASHDAD